MALPDISISLWPPSTTLHRDRARTVHFSDGGLTPQMERRYWDPQLQAYLVVATDGSGIGEGTPVCFSRMRVQYVESDRIDYPLTFFQMDSKVLQLTASPEGNRFLYRRAVRASRTYWTDETFWTLLASLLDVPRTELFPVPLQDHAPGILPASESE